MIKQISCCIIEKRRDGLTLRRLVIGENEKQSRNDKDFSTCTGLSLVLRGKSFTSINTVDPRICTRGAFFKLRRRLEVLFREGTY